MRLSKASMPTQVARLAMILTVLEQAVESSISGGEPQIWDTDITVSV